MSKNKCLDIIPLALGPEATRRFRRSGVQADGLCHCQVRCVVVCSGFLCKAKESKKDERADNTNPPAKFMIGIFRPDGAREESDIGKVCMYVSPAGPRINTASYGAIEKEGRQRDCRQDFKTTETH